VASDSADSGGAAGHFPVEESLSSQETSSAGEDVLLRTLKKILNGPGSTPVVKRGGGRHAPVVERTQTDSNAINELSLECLAALRSSPFLDGVGERAGPNESVALLQEPESSGDGCNDACGQARLESRGDSDELGSGDVSDVLLQSVDASGSLAAAGCEPIEDASLMEGTSLLEDYEAMPVNRTAESAPLFQYVYTATPSGEPSVPVRKALVADFEQVRIDEELAAGPVASVALGSTPMGEPSGPVAKSLMQMFDQCLSPSPAKATALPTSPGQAAQEEDNGADPLRCVVKRLAFPSEEDGTRAPDCTYHGAPQAGAAIMATLAPGTQAAPMLYSSSRPMSAALTRPAKTAAALASRPMSAMSRRVPAASRAAATLADTTTATRSRAAAYTAAVAAEGMASSTGAGGALGARRGAPTMAWSAPKVDSEHQTVHSQDVAAAGDAAAHADGCVASGAGGGGGGLFSAARAQAREVKREGLSGSQREAQPSVRLAPPIRSPTERGGMSPLALFGNSAGPNSSAAKGCRQRSSSRPPSESLAVRPANTKGSRAASVSPHRQMFASAGLMGAMEIKPSAAALGWAAAGGPSHPPRRSPSPSTAPLSTITNVVNSNVADAYASAICNSQVGRGGIRPQPHITLNNKMDLMASVRLARRAQVHSALHWPSQIACVCVCMCVCVYAESRDRALTHALCRRTVLCRIWQLAQPRTHLCRRGRAGCLHKKRARSQRFIHTRMYNRAPPCERFIPTC
jgi:hypothetical protein